MAATIENPTHLETHTGKTKKFRIQAAAPTEPAPKSGEVYIDNTSPQEAIGIYKVGGWVYLSLIP